MDTGLTDGVGYCYKVTSYYDVTCESGFSNIVCTSPNPQGQTNPSAGVSLMETGIYAGRGKKTCSLQSTFNAGDGMVVRALVLDEGGQPVSNATVEIVIGGSETVILNSGPSGAEGWAEATWNTKALGRGSPGTTAGDYTATTMNVTASGFNWDGVTTSTTFTIQ